MVKPPPPLELPDAPEPEVLGKILRVGADVTISSGLAVLELVEVLELELELV